MPLLLVATVSYAQNGRIIYPDQPVPVASRWNNYQNYDEQGQANYHNTSEWYNKDNNQDQGLQTPIGVYTQPGNSNPQNQQLYRPDISPGLPQRTVNLDPNNPNPSTNALIIR